MSFFECEFPRTYSFLAVGGPTRSTTINQGFSGSEGRNKNWAGSRRKFQLQAKTPKPGQGTNPLTQQAFLDALIAFFENVGAQADGFRFFDHQDNAFANETIGAGAGTFQLIKTYSVGGRSYVRNITKPIWSTAVDYLGHDLPNTVQVSAAGVVIPYGGSPGWTLDATTGLVTVTESGAPPITASGQFDVPVRLNSDEMKMQAEASAWQSGRPVITWQGIELLEVFPPNY